MSAIIALLGFSSCSSDDEPEEYSNLMYGCPYGTFKVSGTVTDEAGAPVGGANIILKDIYSVSPFRIWTLDTLTTNNAGKYNKEFNTSPDHKIRLVCEDPGSKLAPDSATVEPHFKGGDNDWYKGTASERVDFKLKKANNK